GAAAGAGFVGALAVVAVWRGHAPAAGANALGAAVVRWLQTAAPQALDNVYPDATPGGVAIAVALGAAIGAIFGGMLDRLPEDHPVAWGAVLALATWAVAAWGVVPALDPVAGRVFEPRHLLAAHLAYGMILGSWVHAGRLILDPPAAPADAA
ncbi:hypothetical protein DCC79_12570, partial [bacterium]